MRIPLKNDHRNSEHAGLLDCDQQRLKLYREIVPSGARSSEGDPEAHARTCGHCQTFWFEARAQLALIDIAQGRFPDDDYRQQNLLQRLGDHLYTLLSDTHTLNLEGVRAVLTQLARPRQNA